MAMASGSEGAASATGGRYEVRSLVRGLRILECIERSRDPLRLTDIANELGIERATLFRYCATLVDLGYLHVEPESKQYSLGPRARALGYAASAQWPSLSIIRSFLPTVAERYRGAASLGVLEGHDVLYVERAVADGSLNYKISIGDRMPAARSSMGKVLLSYVSEGDARRAIRAVDADADADALLQEIARSRTERMALNIGGAQAGLNSVAVAVFEPGSAQPFGAINLAGAATDLTPSRLRSEVGPALLGFADWMAAGGTGSFSLR